MNCNHCGAPMQLRLEQQHFYCEYCTSRYFPEENQDGVRILDEQSNLKCPVCRTFMVYGFIGNTQIYFCTTCRGMLVDQESFLELIDFLREKSSQLPVDPPPVDLAELDRKLSCPTCTRPMSTHLYGGPGNLVVDNCVNCNHLWLDNSEFTRIIRSPGRKQRIQNKDDYNEFFQVDS